MKFPHTFISFSINEFFIASISSLSMEVLYLQANNSSMVTPNTLLNFGNALLLGLANPFSHFETASFETPARLPS